MTCLPHIILGVTLNVAAQVFLKFAMRSIGYFEFCAANILPIGTRALTNPYIYAGLACYGLSVIVWMMVLSRLDVSVAYPITSLGYILTALAGFYFFSEDLSVMRIVGIFVIILGVYLVSRS